MAIIDTAEIGRLGGKSRAKKMTAKQRSESASKAVNARWEKERAGAKAVVAKKASKKAAAKKVP